MVITLLLDYFDWLHLIVSLYACLCTEISQAGKALTQKLITQASVVVHVHVHCASTCTPTATCTCLAGAERERFLRSHDASAAPGRGPHPLHQVEVTLHRLGQRSGALDRFHATSLLLRLKLSMFVVLNRIRYMYSHLRASPCLVRGLFHDRE